MKQVLKFESYNESKKSDSVKSSKKAKGYWTELDFESKDEYFQYFIDSYINGNFSSIKGYLKTIKENGDIKALKDCIKECGGKHKEEIFEWIIENL